LPAWPARAVVTAAGGPVYESHPNTEPSGTHFRDLGGTNVVFAYGTVVPSFGGWLTHQPERQYVDLDSTWRFAPDPDARGVDRGWNQPGFDDSRWMSVAVPSSWDLFDTPGFSTLDGSAFGRGTAFLDGYGWFRRQVELPESRPDRHLRINFLAVGYSADVWLDGAYLGKHEGASAPFSLPIPTPERRTRRRTLVVRVYRRASYTSYLAASAIPVNDVLEVPWKPVDYWPYAGITRSVWIESVAATSIAKLLVSAVPGRIDVRVVLTNHSEHDVTGRVVVELGEASGVDPQFAGITLPAGAAVVVPFDVLAPDAPLWSPQHPTILTARASLFVDGREKSECVDSLTTTYGIRQLRVASTGLELNGKRLFLKGSNWHEETAARGRSMTIAEYDTELGHLLALGVNLVRNCVYTRHPYVYDWADRHGVLVMDDIDAMWLNTTQERLQTERYGLCRAMALNSAWNQHNHPSVALWGLQNESEIDGGGAPIYRAWLSDMKAAVKAVDLSARPVTWASSTTNDPAFDLADVIGFNEYFGYFYGVSSDLGPAIDAVHAAHADKPILITENGTWAIAGRHGNDSDQGTEEWQSAYLQDHWTQVVARSEYVAGYTIWVLKDYKERAGYNQAYNGVSVMGLLTFDTETPKLAYRTFRDLPMPR
jgi:beta-glucuronidase